jgi:hypothetical protein
MFPLASKANPDPATRFVAESTVTLTDGADPFVTTCCRLFPNPS